MSLSPANGTFHKGQNFTVAVVVDADVPVNAVSGIVTFPTANLEVIGVNKTNSIVNLWVQEPSFSNAAASGNVQFEGVILNPGFAGRGGRVINIVFRAKSEGSANINFLEFAALANDGLGTNVGDAGSGSRFIITAPAVPAATQSTPPPGARTGAAAPDEESTGLGYWDVLPRWIQLAVLALIGIATIILALLVLVFGIIILVWAWNQAWRRKNAVVDELESFPRGARRFARAVSSFLGGVRRELGGDIAYGASQLKRELSEAKSRSSLRELIGNYWNSTLKILKRFVTINLKD